jgi:hypothetical protein
VQFRKGSVYDDIRSFYTAYTCRIDARHEHNRPGRLLHCFGACGVLAATEDAVGRRRLVKTDGVIYPPCLVQVKWSSYRVYGIGGGIYLGHVGIIDRDEQSGEPWDVETFWGMVSSGIRTRTGSRDGVSSNGT